MPPIAQVLLSGVTPPRWAGKIFGLFSIIQVLGGAIGVALIGFLSADVFVGGGKHLLAFAVSVASATFAASSVPIAFWLWGALRGYSTGDDR